MTEDPQRFEAASLVSLFGAVLLLVSPFLTWFDPGGSAWSLFELLDLVLIVLALYVGVTATARLLDVAPADGDPRGIPIAGGVALVAVLATMLEPPPVALDASTGFGAWLALFASLLILAAGLLELARVSVTVSLGARAREEEPPPPPVRADRPPPSWPTSPDDGDPKPAGMPRSSPAPTEAPPSRSPSLLRPTDPESRSDQVPEGD